MKIAISTRRFVPPLVGGVDVYTDRLGRALQRMGHEIVILAFDSETRRSDETITVSQDKYNGTKVWRLEFAFDQRPKEAFDHAYDPQMGRVIKGVLQEERPDLFIIMNFYLATLASVEAAKDFDIPVAHIATDFLPVCRRATFVRWDGAPCQVGESIKSCSSCFVSRRLPGRLTAKLLNYLPEETLVQFSHSPVVSQRFHPLSLFKPYWKQVSIMERRLKILRSLRQKIDLVLTPTQFTMQVFLANGFKPEQVHFLPFAVEPDHPLAKVEHEPADHTRFLFVGRLQPYKGAHLLVEAFNSLESPKGATLTIYGTSDGHDAYFNQLTAMMAANNRIKFAGQIPPSALGNAFAKADFFVLPSTWHENSPLILLDALQSKTPVIASNIGGVTDVVKDEVNGLLFSRGDQQALQRVMQRVINHPPLAGQLRSGVNLSLIDDYAQMVLALCHKRVSLPNSEDRKVLV